METGAKKVVECKCGCCGVKFQSGVARGGERLCKDCVELRRSLKGFLKRGLSGAEVVKRGKKLLKVGAKKEVEA